MNMSIEDIRRYWTEQAQKEGESHAASWSDLHAINLEIDEIGKRLADGSKVIDIGCANGFSTVQYATLRKLNIKGVDYIPEMIETANARLSSCTSRLESSITFSVGDITDLKNEQTASFDAAVVTRVIINLGTRETQKKALLECARVLKPGGRLLLSEATVEGWQKINDFRQEWKLPPIPEPSFNKYLDHDFLSTAAQDCLTLDEVVNFSSSYFVFTRVIKPLLAQALNNGVNAAEPLMEWNRFFSMMPSVGDYGTQKLYIYTRR